MLPLNCPIWLVRSSCSGGTGQVAKGRECAEVVISNVKPAHAEPAATLLVNWLAGLALQKVEGPAAGGAGAAGAAGCRRGWQQG